MLAVTAIALAAAVALAFVLAVFAAIAAEFLAELTVATDRIRLGQLLELIGSVRFDRLTPERLEDTLAALRRSGRSHNTASG